MSTLTSSSRPAFTTAPVDSGNRSQYNLPIGYLRAFVTVLVLAFHSVLAYDPDAPQAAHSLLIRPLWWTAFPVVDAHRWSGFRLFVGFNDTFFMSLMFFLSGLFVWDSVERKGTRTFLRGRALRLGVPFVIAAAVVAPLAYYPAYLQTAGPHSVGGYLHEWLSLGEWPAGPAWFVWVLLAFDCFAAALFSIAPRAGKVLASLSADAANRPARLFCLLVVVSGVAYIPMAMAFNPFRWSTFGPFYFQTSRILHYGVYFLAGISVGAFGLDRGLLAPAGKLARRWWLWGIRAVGAFGFAMIAAIVAITSYSHAPRLAVVLGGSGFVLSCAASCFAFLAFFVRFVQRPNRVSEGLRDNAYGMYLIHYVFVSWVQYSLLQFLLPGLVKGIMAFAAVLALSVVTTAALRRVPAVARVI
ncbi:MAG: acyltransferase [Acidobacteriaceae bacterium]|nr:acyltransferase [Acidobacteriaceae bacterium]